MILKENDKIGRYTVQYLIKSNAATSNYRVSTDDGSSYFLKLFDISKMTEGQLFDNIPVEVHGSKRINHKNLIKYVDDGRYEVPEGTFHYLVTEFLVGELLSDDIERGGHINEQCALDYFKKVLEGLKYMHNTAHINHNDITPRNILLCQTPGGNYEPKIIDLGHVSGNVCGSPSFPIYDLNIFYTAPEALVGIFTDTSDAFSAACVLYFMLTGKTPWACEIDFNEPYHKQKTRLRESRKTKLDLSGFSQLTQKILNGGLDFNVDTRLSVSQMLKLISPSDETQEQEEKTEKRVDPTPDNTSDSSNNEGGDKYTSTDVEIKRNTGKGGGFKDVAGMEKLKTDLTNRIIWILKDKEKAEKYKLTPPNGMLLYGPPGCGKTFFAEKFAEESGFNYMMINGSDLGSTYIHGTQGKIADVFKKAKANAPIIVCFDEFDSFVPSRKSRSAENRAEEVNEFLAQLNNCSKNGIFVIGTTNLKEMIDEAVLRKGRLDLQYEIPAPDDETRNAMFKLYLKGRPLSDDIDIDALTALTAGYASSDIAFLINEASLMAALADRLICQNDIVNAIKCNPSSLKKSRPSVGYKQ